MQWIELDKKEKTAFVALGGSASAFFWHFGVMKELQRHGFKQEGGKREAGQERKYRHDILNPVIGASAGSVFAAYIAGGNTVDDMYDAFNEKDPVKRKVKKIPQEVMLFKNPDYWKNFRQVLKNNYRARNIEKLLTFEAQEELSFLEKVKRLVPRGRNMVNAQRYCTNALEEFIEKEYLHDEKDFGNLSTELGIIATRLDSPGYELFSERNMGLFAEDTTIARTIAASSATPFKYVPVCIKDRSGRGVYYTDGESGSNNFIHFHEDILKGVDLIIMSSIHHPYSQKAEIGSMKDFGQIYQVQQFIYQIFYSSIREAKTLQERLRNGMDYISKQLKGRMSEREIEELMSGLENIYKIRRDLDVIHINAGNSSTLFFNDSFDISAERFHEISRLAEYTTKRALRRLK